MLKDTQSYGRSLPQQPLFPIHGHETKAGVTHSLSAANAEAVE